ncbi:hypothetical protein [Bosea sp. (in: a-proteobacteria)]|uniref:hypothetical protein n=1 Tax=Bosea sp. (in: a-proteobacteria) TaxID=1871050 RepID=UPI002FCBA7F3
MLSRDMVLAKLKSERNFENTGWCRTLLASFKCPRTVIFTEVPKTSTGKTQKFKLREMARAL